MCKCHILRSIFFVCLIAVSPPSVTADEPHSSASTAEKKIDTFMSSCFENEVFHGTVLIARDGAVIYKSAFGRLRPHSAEKIDTDSSFYLASVSKQFTSMAVMMLKERQMLSYDDSLSKWFPELPEFAKNITLRHLMTHTSGLPDPVKQGVAESGMTNEDVVEFVTASDLLFQPGEQYEYSNPGYVLLALIVEKVSRQSFAEFLNSNIFEPLHMDHTWVRSEITRRDSAVAGYDMFGDPWDHKMFTTGSGGIYSSVNDLLKWDVALRQHMLVREKTLAEAFSRATLNSGKQINSGFGWEMNDDAGVVFHAGSWCGFRSLIYRDTNTNETIILLTNRGEMSRLFEISDALQLILKGKSFESPPRIAALQLRRYVLEHGSDGVFEYYMTLKNEEDNFVFSESHLRRLGVFLHRVKQDPKAALVVFALNVQEHPDNYRAHDYLANAYLRSGDFERAENTFNKSLTLNPSNAYALRKLKAIKSALQKNDEFSRPRPGD